MPVRNLDLIRNPFTVVRTSQENEEVGVSMVGGSLFGKIGKFLKKSARWVKNKVVAPVVEKAIPWVADKGLNKLGALAESVPVLGDVMNVTGATDYLKGKAGDQVKKFSKKVGKKIRGKGVKKLTKKDINAILA